MKIIGNFFLLALLFTLLMLPLTVIDIASVNFGGAQVLSGKTVVPNVVPETNAFPQQSTDSYDAQQSSPAVDVSQFDYYQMPSLYMGVPEGVE